MFLFEKSSNYLIYVIESRMIFRVVKLASVSQTGACSTATCSSVISKNVEADGGNPNLYHSIEDLKTDHLYDEIKHKGENTII